MKVVLRFPDGAGLGTKLIDVAGDDLLTADLGGVYVALAREQRFGGLLPGRATQYSVLQHSMLVAYITEIMGGSHMAILGAQIHDLHEGVGLRDLPSPVKAWLREFENYAYDSLCDHVDQLFEARFGVVLTEADRALIKRADMLALRVEQSILQGVQHNIADEGFEAAHFAAAQKYLATIYLCGKSMKPEHMAIAFESALELWAQVATGQLTPEGGKASAKSFSEMIMQKRDPAAWSRYQENQQQELLDTDPFLN